MNRFLEIGAIAFSIALAVTGQAEVAGAGDAPAIRTINPLAAISFDAGGKHGVGYFMSAAKHCMLVLTIAEQPDWDGPTSFTVTRHELSVPAGAVTRYNSTEGKALEFACLGDASQMSVREVERVVAK